MRRVELVELEACILNEKAEKGERSIGGSRIEAGSTVALWEMCQSAAIYGSHMVALTDVGAEEAVVDCRSTTAWEKHSFAAWMDTRGLHGSTTYRAHLLAGKPRGRMAGD